MDETVTKIIKHIMILMLCLFGMIVCAFILII